MKIFILFVSFFIFFYSLSAQIPRTISYQGVLTDNSGNFISDGNHTLTLNLYDNLNSPSSIYSETQTVIVVKGLFNVIIGSVNPLPTSVRFDRAYFLGVSLDFAPEMSPRTALTAVPYALRAERANVAESLDPAAVGVVKSLNSLQGNVNLVGAGGTNVNQSGSTITISSSAGGQGIQGIQNTDGIIKIDNGSGPVSTIGLTTNGVIAEQVPVFRDGRWQIASHNSYSFNSDIFEQISSLPFFGRFSINLKTSGVSENNILKFRNGKWQFLPPLDIIAGSGISLTTVTPGPDKITISAADNSPTNEIQSLNFNAQSKLLSISSGNSVDLSSLANANQSWLNSSGSNIYNSNFGNVGIGTSTPIQKLHVNGNLRLQGDLLLGSVEKIFDGGSNTIAINSTLRPDISNSKDIGTSSLKFKDLYLGGRILFGSIESLSDGGSSQIQTNSTFRPETNNSRDLGTSANRWRDVWCARNAFNASDSRMKRNIVPLNYGLKELSQLNAYSYYWNSESMDDGYRYLGVIAQELKEIMPELVREGSDDQKLLSVNYIGLIPVLVNAIKEQQRQIVEIQSQLNSLK